MGYIKYYELVELNPRADSHHPSSTHIYYFDRRKQAEAVMDCLCKNTSNLECFHILERITDDETEII